jgi:tRNA pseudouridine13 synthase
MRINELSRVGGKGGLRAAVAPVKDFKLQDLEPNENSSGCLMTLSFLLLRGSYATIVMREIMKPEDPLKAGF